MQPIFFRVVKLLTLAITIPVVLFLARCAQHGERQAEQGRKWCEGVIAIFETDRAAFLTKHAKRMHHGLLVLRPSSEPDPGAADFAVKQSGEYVCRYWHDGVFFPQGHRYNSERRRWVRIE